MKLYNTLTRQKEEFTPIDENEVKIYSCGPTVYNYFHIGNARAFVVFDTLRRYLEFKGYKVKFVQNFTDIDDKMILNAQRENTTVKELAEKFIREYFTDAEGLNIKKATVHPRATENIDAIIETIKKLVDNGYAYEVDGDVYFEASKFAEYGKLSKQNLEELEAGARISVEEKKKHPMDFALWKAQKPGEPAWDSPWGKGRPGWHIECSAMANRYLGETIDIHSGGQDLVFPHHENEIAQSEAANGKPFARFWLHNGFVNIDNEKMSKSAGNFFTVREIAQQYDYEVIRFFILSAHYRNPINFSREQMDQAKSGLERIYNCIDNLKYLLKTAQDRALTADEVLQMQKIDSFEQKFIEAMDDDLNTADGLAAIFELVKEANTVLGPESPREIISHTLQLIKKLGGVLGLLYRDSGKDAEEELDEEIKQLIEKRQQARKEKNYALADKIRDELKEKGIILEDTPQGVKVTRRK